MSKNLAAPLLAAIGGIALGVLVIAPLANSEASNAPATIQLGSDADQESQADGTPGERQAANERSNRASTDRPQRKQRASANTAQSSDTEVQRQLEALRAANADMEKRNSILSGAVERAMQQGFDPGKEYFTPEQIAERREKAAKLSAEITGAIEAKDKATLIQRMEEMGRLGSVTSEEFFKAFEAIVATGVPNWQQPNGIGLNRWEFYQLIPEALRDVALDAMPGAVPAVAQRMAVDLLEWDQKKSDEDKLAALDRLYANNTTDTQLTESIFRAYGEVDDERAGKTLGQAAVNGSLTPELRLAALREMVGMDQGQDWGVVESLQNDPDQRIADTARRSVARRVQIERYQEVRKAPPASGYLVSQVVESSSAQAAGIEVSDIIVRYHNTNIVNAGSLEEGKRSAQGQSSVQVEVVRNGLRYILNIKPGQLGVNGEYVAAK